MHSDIPVHMQNLKADPNLWMDRRTVKNRSYVLRVSDDELDSLRSMAEARRQPVSYLIRGLIADEYARWQKLAKTGATK